MYHLIGTLHASVGGVSKFAQLHFHDTENEALNNLNFNWLWIIVLQRILLKESTYGCSKLQQLKFKNRFGKIFKLYSVLCWKEPHQWGCPWGKKLQLYYILPNDKPPWCHFSQKWRQMTSQILTFQCHQGMGKSGLADHVQLAKLVEMHHKDTLVEAQQPMLKYVDEIQ